MTSNFIFKIGRLGIAKAKLLNPPGSIFGMAIGFKKINVITAA